MKKQIYSNRFVNFMLVVIALSGTLILFNQFQISSISSSLDTLAWAAVKDTVWLNDKSLSNVDVSEITSTAMAVAMLFPVNQIQNGQDAIDIMIASGTPEYSEVLGGITFDDPVDSMEYLAKWYYVIKEEVKQDPETWQRYLNLAAAPRGISCEFCCGLGAQGITANGDLMCGCKHLPAIHAVVLGLIKYTDYSDAEVLREAMRWKAMFFPKDMVGLAMEVAGTDPSELKELPGMVGGC